MNDKEGIIRQSHLAFEFIQKLYLEISYLIKELEGLLYEEDEKFIIGRPSGNAITTRSSRGLDSTNVSLWIVRKLAVFFVPKESTKLKGQTYTGFDSKLKIIYLRIVLDEKNMKEPCVYSGVLYDFVKKTSRNEWPQKFEHLMGSLEYWENKIFRDPKNINYEDQYIKFKGKLMECNLFDINSGEEIVEKILQPTLKLYRAV